MEVRQSHLEDSEASLPTSHQLSLALSGGSPMEQAGLHRDSRPHFGHIRSRRSLRFFLYVLALVRGLLLLSLCYALVQVILTYATSTSL
jgi:hypothetical protein